MNKAHRDLLQRWLKRYVKWYDENYGAENEPSKEILDALYSWLDAPLTPLITRKKFRILFDLRLADYIAKKKGV